MVTSIKVCICGHSRGDHMNGRHLCQSQDIDQPEFKCNCDWYDTAPDPSKSYCDDCILAVEDEGIYGLAEQYDALALMGSDMADHECERLTEPSTRCDCRGHNIR